MNTAYFYLTDEGGKLAHKLAAAHPGDIYNKENFKENLRGTDLIFFFQWSAWDRKDIAYL